MTGLKKGIHVVYVLHVYMLEPRARSWGIVRASAYLQVLGFKDGPGLRVLVLTACCFLAYAASCLACKVFA